MQLEACIVEIISKKTASSNTPHGGYSSEGATARDENNNMHHIITQQKVEIWEVDHSNGQLQCLRFARQNCCRHLVAASNMLNGALSKIDVLRWKKSSSDCLSLLDRPVERRVTWSNDFKTCNNQVWSGLGYQCIQVGCEKLQCSKYSFEGLYNDKWWTIHSQAFSKMQDSVTVTKKQNGTRASARARTSVLSNSLCMSKIQCIYGNWATYVLTSQCKRNKSAWMRVDVQRCKKKVQGIWVETGFKGARQHAKAEVQDKGARQLVHKA